MAAGAPGSRTVRAAVLEQAGRDLALEDIEVGPPRDGEVAVRVVASGICHSDLSVQVGDLPSITPMVLGHEAAGIVESVGQGVESVREGDHVVVCCMAQCGICSACLRGEGNLCERFMTSGVMGVQRDGSSRFTRDQHDVFQFMGAGTFSPRIVISETALVKVDRDLPLDQVAVVGCGVITGVGSAINTAPVTRGSTVAVIGCGGVGLNVIQGARIAGAARIVAVDMQPNKLELATVFGATDTVLASTDERETVGAVRALTPVLLNGHPSGVDIAFDVVGATATQKQAIRMSRPGGTVVLVGVPPVDARLELRTGLDLVLSGRTIKGSALGSTQIRRDVPKLLDLYRRGELRLAELISGTIPLARVNDALRALTTGEVARSVILHDHD